MISEGKKESVKVGAYVFLSAFLGKLVSVPSTIVVASVLGPAEFGLLAIVNIIIQYMSYSSLGMLMNLNREVPISYGRGDGKDVKLTYNVVFTNYIFTTVGALIILWVLTFLGFDFGDGIGAKILLIVTLIVLSSNMSSFLNAYLRAEGKFIIYGQFEIVSKVVIPLSTLVLAYFFGLLGVLISLALGHLIGFLFIYLKLKRPKFNITFSKSKTVSLFRTGSLMFTAKVLDGILLSLGILIVSYFFSEAEVGIFGFALALIAVKKVPFAKAFSITINRKMGLEAGKNGIQNYQNFRKYFERTLIMFLLLCTLVVGLAFLVYSAAIDLFLDKYKDSIMLMLILFSVIIFYNTRVFIYNYLNITNQMVERIKVLFIGLIVATGMSIFLVNQGYGLLGIAISLAISYLIISLRLILIVFNQVFNRKNEVIGFLVKVSIISVALTALLYFLYGQEWFNSNEEGNAFLYYAIVFSEVLLKAVVFVFLCCSLFMILFKNYKVFDEFLGISRHYLSLVFNKLKRTEVV